MLRNTLKKANRPAVRLGSRIAARFAKIGLMADLPELKRRAERYGRSMEEEARHILRNALKQANQPAPRLGSRIAARFAKTGLTADLPELHGQSARSADFGK